MLKVYLVYLLNYLYGGFIRLSQADLDKKPIEGRD